eukprot:TRINITY_DN81211_c0_g1_i1.p1 TRINITY_DN81211_c0_g1~~TRINITY_DN81211_c0_g1_i1.p1  ORF type:complete len:990 (-),score=170.23 TRINITY_DN81211_c0_g1_i1:95-2977(-)
MTLRLLWLFAFTPVIAGIQVSSQGSESHTEGGQLASSADASGGAKSYSVTTDGKFQASRKAAHHRDSATAERSLTIAAIRDAKSASIERTAQKERVVAQQMHNRSEGEVIQVAKLREGQVPGYEYEVSSDSADKTDLMLLSEPLPMSANVSMEAKAARHGPHQDGDHAHAGAHPQDAIAFMLLALSAGVLNLKVLDLLKQPFPYTALLFLQGALVAWIHFAGFNLGSLSRSIDLWVDIDPHLIIFLFLPCLLFAEGINLKWIYVKGAGVQVLLLAFPGVIVGTLLIAWFAVNVFPYNWNASTGICLGAILSATDPVAVLAILKELGCSNILGMQIAGESLLNDGSSMVVWFVAFEKMRGHERSPLDIILLLTEKVGLGTLFGLVVTMMLIFFLMLTSNKLEEVNPTMQIASMLLVPYILFYISETELNASGVLAVVSGAICMARGGQTLFADRVGMHHFWHSVEFIANTIVFWLAGTIVAEICTHRSAFINAMDWVYLLLLYLACIAARYAMLLLFYPILKTTGFGIAFEDFIIIGWSGLRGAVGLSLAMFLDRDNAIDNRTGALMLFHVSGVAALTLLINAPTCGWLVRRLGLALRHWSEERIIDSFKSDLRTQVRSMYRDLGTSKRFQTHDSQQLLLLMPVLRGMTPFTRQSSVPDSPRRLRSHQSPHSHRASQAELVLTRKSMQPAPSDAEDDDLEDGEEVDEGALQTERELFLSMVRTAYWDMIDKGELQPRCRATSLLLASAEYAVANSHWQLCDWRDLLGNMMVANTALQRFWMAIKEGHFLGHRFVPCRRGSVIFDAYKLVCFMDAHEYAQQRHEEFHEKHGDDSLRACGQRIRKESKAQVEAAKRFMQDNRLGDAVIARVRTKQLAFRLLAAMSSIVDHWKHQGTVSYRDAEDLSHEINKSFKAAFEHTGEKEPDDVEAAEIAVRLDELRTQIGDTRASAAGRRSVRLASSA